MSIPRNTSIICPQCRKQFQVTIFESLNTDYTAHVPERVITGELFDAKCPQCGCVSHLNYDFLYHDLIHCAMIWVVSPQQKDYSRKLIEVRATRQMDSYFTRIVSDMEELKEKVSCLEAGLDDRVIELCKVELESLIRKQLPVKNSFFTFLKGEALIYVIPEKGHAIKCHLSEMYYNMIKAFFANALEQNQNHPYPIIDHEWAAAVYNHENGAAFLTQQLQDEEKEISAEHTTPEEERTSNHSPSPVEKEHQISFCRKCGKKLIPGSEFCRFCGTKIAVDPLPTPNPKRAELSTPVHFPSRSLGKVTCPICSLEQKATRTCCFKCGTKFIFDDEPQPEIIIPELPLEPKAIEERFVTTGVVERSEPASLVNHSTAELKPPQQESIGKELGMAWYKFIIYFQMITSPIVLILNGFQYFSGSYFGTNTEAIYAAFPSVKILNMVFGIFLFCLAVYGFIVRSNLKHFESRAPKRYTIYLGIIAISAIFYLLFLSLITGVPLSDLVDTKIISHFIVSVILIAVNVKYFRNRAHLFMQ